MGNGNVNLVSVGCREVNRGDEVKMSIEDKNTKLSCI